MPTLFDLKKFCTDKTYTGKVEVRLISSPPNSAPPPQLVASCTEVAFDGYKRAEGDIWSTKGVDSGGNPMLVSNLLDWVLQPAGSPATVTGLIVVGIDGADETLLGFVRTPGAVTIEAANRSIGAIVQVSAIQAGLI